MFMSHLDHSRLAPLVADALSKQNSPVLDALDEMLAEATLVPPEKIPPDLVTMNSEVVVEDATGGAPRRLRLVYGAPEPGEEGRTISVFSPMGAALLGARVGEAVPVGRAPVARELRISAMPYQPESQGHWDR